MNAQRSSRGRNWKMPLAIVLVGVAAFVVASTPSVESGFQEAKSGTVVDKATQQPIAGAHVVVFWYHHHVNRSFFGHGGGGGDRCLLRKDAQTDAAGRYTIGSTQHEVEIERTLDPEYDDAYFLGIRTYAPGYYRPDYKLQRDGSYPPVRSAMVGGAQVIDPIALTKDGRPVRERAFEVAGLPADLMCQRHPGDPVSFESDIYREAYPLVCEQGGLAALHWLVDLRLDAVPVMPALPPDVATQLNQFIKHYRLTEPVPSDEQARICALLKQANEVKP